MVMKRPMAAFLTQLLLAIRSRFTRRARLEAENLLLRQQLVVLRRKGYSMWDRRICIYRASFALSEARSSRSSPGLPRRS